MADKNKKAALIKRQLDEADARKKKVFGWIKFGVQLWAIRMAFAMFGMTIPFAINFYNEIFQIDNTIHYSSELRTISWFEIVRTEFKAVIKARADALPFRISGVPVISGLALRLFFENNLPINAIQAKISSQELFVHYSADRLWASKYNISKKYEYVTLGDYNSHVYRCQHRFNPYLHLDQLRSVSDFECREDNTCSVEPSSAPLHYMYATLTPLSPPYVSSLVPSLSHLYYSQSTDPQVSLWLSSPGSTAALHYDMEDNFLLQIAGNKTLLLVSPEAVGCVKPHSSLHPHWRQSQLGSELVTSRAVYQLLHSNDTGSLCSHKNSDDTALFPSVWEVVLQPGDMVYIPAGFFHSVVAGTDSLSVNSWFSSTMSEAYASLLNAHLPFDSSDSVSVKLASLASLVKKLVAGHGLLNSDYGSLMMSRYSELVKDENTFHCTPVREPLCSSRDILVAKSSRLVVRSSNSIYSLLTHTKLTSGVLSLLLLDYIEDIMQMVVYPPEELSPCFMLSFVHSCL